MQTSIQHYSLDGAYEMAMAAKKTSLAVFGSFVEWPAPDQVNPSIFFERLQNIAGDYRKRTNAKASQPCALH